MATDGEWLTGPNGERVWQAAPAKPKRRAAAGAATATNRRRELSPAERAERLAYERDRLELRRRELETLEALVGSSLAVAGDPSVPHERLIPLDARTAAGRELATCTRASGSALRVMARTYDGQAGQKPKFYALVAVWFRSPRGGRFRSKGTAIEGPELRKVARALLDLADEFDAACEAGVEPWAVPSGAWASANAEPSALASTSSDVDGDCVDCGGELPDGHLKGCPQTVDDDVPSEAPPAPLKRSSSPPVKIRCADVAAAGRLAATLQHEGVRAGHYDPTAPVVLVQCASELEAEALTERLTAQGLRVEHRP